MDLLNTFASLFSNFGNLTWQMVVMWGIGALLIYLAIAKNDRGLRLVVVHLSAAV